MQSFSVTILVRPEQVEQLKELLADLRDSDQSSWRDWKDYARTVAAIGFEERLEARTKLLTHASAAEPE